MDTKMITALHSMLDAVVDEAENNEDFASKLELAFTGNSSSIIKKERVRRRQKPVLNPLDIIEDMNALNAKLHTLSVELSPYTAWIPHAGPCSGASRSA